MNDTDSTVGSISDHETPAKPKRPAKSFNPNRRPTPSELRNTIKALTNAVKKEEKRNEKVSALKKQIDDLSYRLDSLRSGTPTLPAVRD